MRTVSHQRRATDPTLKIISAGVDVWSRSRDAIVWIKRQCGVSGKCTGNDRTSARQRNGQHRLRHELSKTIGGTAEDINFGAAGPRLTTHVLDTARGTPAGGVPVILSLRNSKGVFEELEQGRTDNDGRCEFLKGGNLQPEVYRFYFDTDLYFRKQNATGFFPYVEVVFRVKAGQDNHYHVPLLLSPHGYTTYHGS
ncbi:HIUH-like protein [Mya arenaria]|uniref:hydroxyisourate hydrolase n=1 Tax=Mya arenaria TaxID=6604 RepID=A0ABY7DQ29_MYAAR|nr:HIUH-like protein [Mya arenaria]